MTKDPRVYLAHILECIQKIERFTKEGRGRFFQDAMVQDAVLRNFEVIGEAAKRLDEAYRAAHPEIPWVPWPVCGMCSSTNMKVLIWSGSGPSSRRNYLASGRLSRLCCRLWNSLSGNSRAKMKPRRTNEHAAPCTTS